MNVWMREDIAPTLMALYASNSATATLLDDSPHSEGYRLGFLACLVSVALMFGLPALAHQLAGVTE